MSIIISLYTNVKKVSLPASPMASLKEIYVMQGEFFRI